MDYLPKFLQGWDVTQEPLGLARYELQQAAQTGRNVAALQARLEASDIADAQTLRGIYDDTMALQAPGDWPHFEGSDLADILAELPTAPKVVIPDRIEDRVQGAWFGRVIGNMVGKPVEVGSTRLTLREYLRATDAYPVTDYIPFGSASEREALSLSLPMEVFHGATRGHVHGSVRDDDIDYTILGLALLENHGTGYTTYDVASEWLARFPIYQLFTAERAAYKNLLRDVPLDRVGEYENPFREWIGALIRADIFGYVAPGDPRRAATLAYPDAILSHRANGVYGEMWAAALVASAFTASGPEDSVLTSLRQVPPTSQLAAEIQAVLADFHSGIDWEEAMDRLEARWDGVNWVHTINNAGALAAAILWGGGDFTTTVGLSVQSGLDTDSIGATAGSWAGAHVGYQALPAHLLDPLEDTCRSAVFGFGESSISSYAQRTLTLISDSQGMAAQHSDS